MANKCLCAKNIWHSSQEKTCFLTLAIPEKLKCTNNSTELLQK